MRIYLKFYFLFLGLMIGIPLFGQNLNKTDSLKKLIIGVNPDTNQVLNFLELAKIYTRIDLDSSMNYTNSAIKLAEKLQFYKGSAQAYRQKGIIYYFKGDYEKAMKNFEQSLSSWEDSGDQSGIARAYLNIGIINKNLGEYDKALENYLRSVEIQKQINDVDGLARNYNNIANIYNELGNYEEALSYSFKSLEIHEKLKNEAEIAVTYNNIGNIYQAQKITNKAIEYNRFSLKINKKLNDKKGMADNYNNLAEIYSSLVDVDTVNKQQKRQYLTQVLENLEKSMTLYKEISYKKGIALTYNNLGDANLQFGNYDKVLENYNKSILAYMEMGDKNGIIISLKNKGVYFDSIHDYKLALSYLIEAKKKAKEIGSPERMMELFKALSYTYSKLSKFKEAYTYHVLYKQISDKLISEANRKNSAQKEYSYKLNKKKKEMELAQQERDLKSQEEIHRQSLIINSAMLGLVLMVLLVFFIFRSYRIKRKANIELAKHHRIIMEQNEELKLQKEEIETQKEEIERQRDIAVQARKEVMDSIEYAKRIQTAALPAKELFVKLIPDYFIFFKPRDIVSGDFYWMKQIDRKIVIVAADCTGHGVPGAFMSLLGIAFLNESVNENLLDPGKILDNLRLRIIDALHQKWEENESKDGMDVAIAVIDLDSRKLDFAGAYNPIYHIRDNKLTEIKGDKMPIGIHIKEPLPFKTKSIQLEKSDRIYIFSDGFADQFGGIEGRKFKYSQFRELLLGIQNMTMTEQKGKLNTVFKEWKGDKQQIDDILVVGMRF